jgi:hypothetical protein
MENMGGGPVGAATPLGGVVPSAHLSEVAVNFVLRGVRKSAPLRGNATLGNRRRRGRRKKIVIVDFQLTTRHIGARLGRSRGHDLTFSGEDGARRRGRRSRHSFNFGSGDVRAGCGRCARQRR